MSYPNHEQAAVLRHLHGTLLVLAPAGTGKTRLMADRLAAVITAGMSPELTLGVTFTNRAAEHMRAAVQHSCGAAAKQCRIQTFHGLCASILRTEARALGLPADFVIYDEPKIKDLLARLRLLFNPADTGALRRMLLRPACGIGAATLQKLSSEGQPCGLRLTDLAQLRSHHDGDPFHALLHALSHGTVVVFDVETTGLSPAEDEVIDLGAVKLVAGRPAGQFEAFLRPTRPLGESAAIHGISEETLQSHGRDPADVFREFARFTEGAVLVGHNVAFDLSMIRAHAARLLPPIGCFRSHSPKANSQEYLRSILTVRLN
jgi:hypothetical protein